MSINGTKITAPVGAHEPYKVMGVAMRSDGWNINYICSNAHGKVSPYSRCKPYRYDYPGELTEAHRKGINYGMTPAYVEYDNSQKKIMGKPWGQWSPPNRSTDWMRLLDFDGYNHSARKYFVSARLYTNNPADSTKPMASQSSTATTGVPGRGFLYGEVEIDNSADGLPAYLFHNPDGTEMQDWRLTLLLGGGDTDGYDTKPWCVQSEPLSSLGSETHVKLTMEVTASMAAIINGNGWNGQNIAVLCLSPKLAVDSAGRCATIPDRAKMISLDMWAEGLETAHTSKDVDAWVRPNIGADVGVFGVMSPRNLAIEADNDSVRKKITFEIDPPRATIYDGAKGRYLTNAQVKLGLRFYQNGKWVCQTVGILVATEGMTGQQANITSISFPELNRFTINYSDIDNALRSSLASGTYTVEACLRITAYGERFDISPATAYTLLDDEAYGDGWADSLSGPDQDEATNGVYSAVVNLGTMTFNR